MNRWLEIFQEATGTPQIDLIHPTNASQHSGNLVSFADDTCNRLVLPTKFSETLIDDHIAAADAAFDQVLEEDGYIQNVKKADIVPTLSSCAKFRALAKASAKTGYQKAISPGARHLGG